MACNKAPHMDSRTEGNVSIVVSYQSKKDVADIIIKGQVQLELIMERWFFYKI